MQTPVNRHHELPGVTAAQFHSFAQRMPSYYASAVVMMLMVIVVFHSVAPGWLSCGIPAVTGLLGTWRGWWWVQHRTDEVSDQQAQRHLRKATITLISSVSLVLGMDIRLFSYGDIYAHFFLLIQILSSATCGFYCLMHLRKAALATFAAVMLPFAGLTLSLGHLSTSIAALTALFTAGVMIMAMLGYERDFFSLVKAKAETSELSKENLRLAHVDMLTGLPNRRHFFDQIESCLSSHGEHLTLPSVGIIDLDGFKPVNDSYGHRVGDQVLEIVASRLARLGGGLPHLCRLGGDEFVFLSAEVQEERLQDLGQAIAKVVSEPITLGHRTVRVGCSVGFAIRKPGSDIGAFDLFEQADYALYHAKRTGRARTVLFTEQHETLIREQSTLEQTLRQADLMNEFYLVYQPIVDLRTFEVTAFECLARWRSPLLGEVSPGRFIPVAEQAGLINEMTQVLMSKALAAAKSWPDHIHLSFNVSPLEMASLEQTRIIVDLIQRSDLDPNRVGIELTETALLNNFTEVRRHMTMIRDTGASIYLDDFGTGHSSLSYIHALPLDKIKVDRSFIQSVEPNGAGLSIIRSVLNLCRDLQIPCVVEGVETECQLEQLHKLNAEFIQGYFFSRPLPENNVLEYLASMQLQT
ncbi:MAG: putative bifunctional diguanylate cyclase/phosphodiesterase [Janthinobacterium lividum]